MLPTSSAPDMMLDFAGLVVPIAAVLSVFASASPAIKAARSTGIRRFGSRSSFR